MNNYLFREREYPLHTYGHIPISMEGIRYNGFLMTDLQGTIQRF